MSELAVMIQYTGIKAKFLEVYKQRARCFRHAFLSFDLRDLRMRRPNYVYLVDWDTAHVKCVWRKVRVHLVRGCHPFSSVTLAVSFSPRTPFSGFAHNSK